MSEIDVQKFSTSRINRLLRPLRNRCVSLASFATEGYRATYSSRTSVNHTGGPDFPPLFLLQPPMKMGSRIHFNKHHIESLEMSQKVYAVRDCFQEIVSKTDGRKTTAMTGTRRRVMSLAAICSIVVGQNMQCEADTSSDDVEDANFVNDIYEAVPLQYRRFALLSHAINLVLNTTIHHPTLLSILLDVTLAHGLLYESNTVLRALLFVAFSPVSTCARPPICHPAHSVFLLEHRTRWIGGGFSDQAFCRIFVEVLDAAQSCEAWGCKAVHKLAKNICGSDFFSFMELASGCTSMASELDFSDRRKIRATMLKQQNTSYVAMRLWTRICQWLDIACDHYITAEEWSMKNSDAVYAFLELSLSSGLHHDICTVDDADILYADLQGAIACLATHWLSSCSILKSQTDSIVRRLREITPRSSTYVTLVTKTFAKLSLSLSQSKLRSFAMVLRLHGLLRLEASLWACALHHIELPAPEHLFESSNRMEEIREYRDCLIDLVDDAEHRCFGVDTPSPDSCHMPSSHAKIDASGSTASRLNCEWQWEATLRCWVCRDNDHPSAKKKRKAEPAETLCLSESRSFHLRRTASIAVQNPSGTTGITRTGNMEGSLAWGSVRRRSSSQSGGEYSTHTRGMRLPLQPSSSNFTSLLADAFSQRTVLRDIREKTTQGRDIKSRLNIQPICLSPTPASSLSNNSEHEIMTLPSDDLLDLFICEGPHATCQE